MKLISIVVPVYKVEKYIESCVDSILSQTYRNIEVILVNDGSPDNCPKICDQYALKDSRVKVIHKANGGSSSARNLGIEYAQGDFIGFVDSDDIVSPTMYEIMCSQIDKYDADIARIESTSKLVKLYCESVIPENKIKVIEKKRLLYYTFNYSGVAAWNGLYKREVVKDSFFIEGAENEDILWSYNVRKKCNKFVDIDLPLYYWNLEPISLSRSGLPTLDNPYYCIEEDLLEFRYNKETLLSCKMKSIEYDFRTITRATIYGFKSLELENSYKTIEKKYIKRFRKNLINIIQSPLFTISVKVQLLLLSINPWFYKLIRKKL